MTINFSNYFFPTLSRQYNVKLSLNFSSSKHLPYAKSLFALESFLLRASEILTQIISYRFSFEELDPKVLRGSKRSRLPKA